MKEMTPTIQGSAKRLNPYTPLYSKPRLSFVTPRFTQNPLSRRLKASARISQDSPEKEQDYSGLLQKTWKIYSLSPLYNFKTSKASLNKYARSLDVAFTQAKVQTFSSDGEGQSKSLFSVYEGLNFHPNDPKAVQIQVTEKSGSDRSAIPVLTAYLMCVDLDDIPVPENLRSHFTYYPVILVCSNKTRTDLLLTWLEQHFDCKSCSVTFSDNDLRWMLATWSCRDVPRKAFPVLLQYSLNDVCDGISTIDCKFDAAFCKQLWERLNGESSDGQVINASEVKLFVSALERHLEYTMHIIFSKLHISEVGTSVAYVSSQGKLKLFSNSGVFAALNLVCEIVRDRLQEIKLTLT